jgi:hypothetical protein
MTQFKIHVKDINCIESISDILVSSFGLTRLENSKSNLEWTVFDYQSADEMNSSVSPVVWRFNESEPYSFIINVSQFFSITEYLKFREILLAVSDFLNQPIQLSGNSFCPWTNEEILIRSLNDFPSYPYIVRRGSEAGCFHAYHRFQNSIVEFKRVMKISNDSIDANNSVNKLYGFNNPTDSLNQYVIPFLFGIYESYMKDTLWCLHWHSDDIVKGNYKAVTNDSKSKLKPIKDLINLDFSKYERRSVLSLKALLDSFFLLLENTVMTNVIDLDKLGRLGALIDRRKLYAHRGANLIFYKRTDLFSDIELIETSVNSFYDFIVQKNGWNSSKEF